MSEILCHHKGKYNYYNTVTDAFRFVSSLTLEQVTHLTNHEYGKTGLIQLKERLSRCHKNGHSCIHHETLEEFLICNRAGENEKKLSYKECIKRYLS